MSKQYVSSIGSEYDRGWKEGMKEADSLLATRDTKLKDSLKEVLAAIKWGKDCGCIDHLDCAPDRKESWEIPLARAKALSEGKEFDLEKWKEENGY
jgi:hypothetical protein